MLKHYYETHGVGDALDRFNFDLNSDGFISFQEFHMAISADLVLNQLFSEQLAEASSEDITTAI
jgi:hypothetical protein